MSDKTNVFYVYALFDLQGIPRYIGKGKNERWLDHERTSSNNQLKNEFIEQTWFILKEVPKIKIREQLFEKEALDIEIALIKAIGRFPNGFLYNQTDGVRG